MAGDTVEIQLVRTEDGQFVARFDRDIASDRDLLSAELRDIALSCLDAALMLDKMEEDAGWPPDPDSQH